VDFPVLFRKSKDGRLCLWRIWTEGAVVCSEHGYENGVMSRARRKAEGKNTGKRNETSPSQQAVLEAAAEHRKRIEGKYSLTPEEAEEVRIRPMLAGKFSKKYAEYPLHVQPKLDGARCLAYWTTDDEVVLLSRGGKEYHAPHIVEAIKRFLPKDTMLDGEIYIHGMVFQQIMRLLKKWRPLESIKLEYHVYDSPIAGGDEEWTWSERYSFIRDLFRDVEESSPVKLTKTEVALSELEVREKQSGYVMDGYEGLIARNMDGLYLFGHRSHHLMKYKEFDDDEFEVIGHTEGHGKEKGCVIWICKTKDGKEFRTRPIGNLDDRRAWFVMAPASYGQLLKVRYFGLYDDGVPRFPVGQGFRLKEDL